MIARAVMQREREAALFGTKNFHASRGKPPAGVLLAGPALLLGIDTLCFLFCLLCYSPIPQKSAYYAQEHAYYSQEGTYYSCS